MKKNKLSIKLPITVVMVIYNEEKLLERAIKSFYDLVDEIIIVHDGECTDNSLEIAKKYTNKVYVKPHIGCAEPHRVFTYKKAKNDWILQVDADEYLSKDLRNNIANLIKQGIDIFAFSWPVFDKGNYYYSFYKSALFRKSKVYFIGVVHGYVKPLNNMIKFEKSNFILNHRPQIDNYAYFKFMKKNMKWAKIQVKQYKTNYRNIPKWNYTQNEWDYPTNLRIKYPILYGMILTPFYHLVLGVKDMFKYKCFYYMKQEFYTSLYFIYLFYNFKFKNENK